MKVQHTLLSPALGALFASALAIPLAAYLWGFTVDDAFIPARVAEHLRAGLGARFNAGGPVTDAVTPLGFAHLLAGMGAVSGAIDTIEILRVARVAGAAAALASVGILGWDLAATTERRSTLVLAALSVASCVPIAAWAGAGLETPLVMLACAWAQRGRPGADVAAGFGGAWRPELLPWSLALVLLRRGGLGGQAASGRALGVGLGLALAPSALVMTIRLLAFGSALPLSSVAKVPEFEHGVFYMLGGVLRSGPFWLLAAPLCVACVVRARNPEVLALLGATLCHLGALVLAGGDWMAFFRLFVPILPSVVLLGAWLDEHARGRWQVLARGARAALVLGSSLLLLVTWGPDTRKVLERRLELIERARPALASARRVAAVDVGWLGAATNADIVDLAGVTDPRIAALVGGHTTKRVAPGLLAERDVDTLVFLAERAPEGEAWSLVPFRYGVEARLARRAEAMGFALTASLPLGGTPFHYLVCSARP